jgi:hypothetical protein
MIIDIDDFFEQSNGLHMLYRLHANDSKIKFNLFTIPGLCSMNFINDIKKIDWIDMLPHGLMHETSRECENWSYEDTISYLNTIEPLGLTKCFKAPGWQISDGVYKALTEKGYWIADQEYNNERRPKNLNAYLLNEPDRHHYHIQNACSNGLADRYDEIASLDGDFLFIKDIMYNNEDKNKKEK